MSPVINNKLKSRISRSHQIVPLATVFMVALLIVSTFFAIAQHSKGTTAQAAGGFSFTAAGDYGQTSYTTANLKYIAKSGASFNLALGDYSYSSAVKAAAWSAYAYSNLSANFPFEILFGDHDTSQMNSYAADLPNRMANITGAYAKQYYFDYPSSGPLARFIMISPTGVPGFNYSKGSADYNWVSSAITTARAANIHWVIVSMVNYCFTIDTQNCGSQDLLDLLLNMHVDLILQAHKHTYQASKQLALNSSTCQTLSATSYNAACVVNSSTSMTRGAGSVIVVTGTGGTSPQLAINTKDPKIGYFRKWMGANVNETWGVSHFTVSATQISMHFVGVTGSFTDSFSING